MGLLYLASFGTVLPPGIPQKLLWPIALWSGLWWTNIQSWTLSMYCLPVILMFCINFADGPKPCGSSYRVTQGVWMGLLWGSFEDYEVPVEVPVAREPGSLPASTRVRLLPLLKTWWGLSSIDTKGTLWCRSPTWTLDSMLSRDQLIEPRNTPNSLNISRSLRKTLFKFNLWNPSFKHTAKVKNHIKRLLIVIVVSWMPDQ